MAVPTYSLGSASDAVAFDRPRPVVVVGPRPLPVTGIGGGLAASGRGKDEERDTERQVSRILPFAVRAASQFGPALAGRPGPFVDAAVQSASMGLATLGPKGVAAAVALTAVKQTADAFATRFRELAGLSGTIAAAQSRADVNRLQRDITEARRLGDQMATLIERTDKAEAAIAAILLPIKEAVLNATVNATGWIGSNKDSISGFIANINKTLAILFKFFAIYMDTKPSGLDELGPLLDQIRKLPAPVPIPLPAPNVAPAQPPIVGGVI